MKIYHYLLLITMLGALTHSNITDAASRSRVAISDYESEDENVPKSLLHSLKKFMYVFEEYIDTGELALALAKIYIKSEGDALKIITTIIPAIKIGRLPLTFSDRTLLLEDLFSEPEKLNEHLGNLVVAFFTNNLARFHFTRLIEDIYGMANWDLIEEELGGNRLFDPKATIAALFRKVPGNDRRTIINLEELPYLCKVVLESIFILPRLQDKLNDVLWDTSIPFTYALDCFCFQDIMTNLGYKDMDSDGVREAIELLIALINRDDDEKVRYFISYIASLGNNQVQARAHRNHLRPTEPLELFVAFMRDDEAHIRDLFKKLAENRTRRRSIAAQQNVTGYFVNCAIV